SLAKPLVVAVVTLTESLQLSYFLSCPGTSWVGDRGHPVPDRITRDPGLGDDVRAVLTLAPVQGRRKVARDAYLDPLPVDVHHHWAPAIPMGNAGLAVVVVRTDLGAGNVVVPSPPVDQESTVG